MPWTSELAQFPTPTMATRIFLMGKKKSYPQRSAWGKMQSGWFRKLRQPMDCEVTSDQERFQDLGVESAVVGVTMQAFSGMPTKQFSSRRLSILLAVLLPLALSMNARSEVPSYEIEQGVALADSQNPEVVIARKKLEAAHGGLIEARSGYLPSVLSSGYAD